MRSVRSAKRSPRAEIRLRIVVSPESVARDRFVWVAQCLEYDIAAQGKSPADAVYELQFAVVGRIIAARAEGLIDAFAGVPKGPRSAWRRFERGSGLTTAAPPGFRYPAERAGGSLPNIRHEARVA